MSILGILFTLFILIEVLDVPAVYAVILIIFISLFFGSETKITIKQIDNDKISYPRINKLQDNDNIDDIKKHAKNEYIKNSRRLTESKLLIQKDDVIEVCDDQSSNCFTASEYIIHTGNGTLYACNSQNYCFPVLNQ